MRSVSKVSLAGAVAVPVRLAARGIESARTAERRSLAALLRCVSAAGATGFSTNGASLMSKRLPASFSLKPGSRTYQWASSWT